MIANILAVVLLGACRADNAAQNTENLVWPAPTLHAVQYRLGWDEESFRRSAGNIVIETDLGYTVELSSGVLQTYAVSLVSCEEAVDRRGHGEDVDVSAVRGPFSEDLVAAETRDLGWTTFSETTYCHVHVVMAASGDLTLNATVDVTAANRSTRSLSLQTNRAHARLEPIKTADAFEDGHALVEIVRRWELDGIDFDDLGDEEVAWAVLSSLSAGMTVRTTPVTDWEDSHTGMP